MKRFSLRALLFVAAIVAVVLKLGSLPRSASVDFPMDRREYILDFYSDRGISGEISRFSANNVATFSGHSGWSTWRNERTILEDAQTRNYFCNITYTSFLGHTWKRSFINGMCGHNRAYANCVDCQSVSRP